MSKLEVKKTSKKQSNSNEIELTIGEIMACNRELSLLNERTVNKTGEILPATKVSAKLGYWLGRLEDKLISIEKVAKKAMDELVKKYGEQQKDDKGNLIPNRYKLLPENGEIYSSELEQLLAQVEVIEFKKLSFELFLLDETDEEGNRKQIELTKSFWSVIGIKFVTEPE